MARSRRLRRIVTWAAAGLGAAAGVYGVRVGIGWYRYGRAPAPTAEEDDALLNDVMPVYEIVERHSVRVAAPADVTFQAATEQDLFQLPAVRAIFRARALMLRAAPDTGVRPGGLLSQVLAMGWGVLAETPGREIVCGAVTEPWEADVVFRALPPDEFVAFRAPGHVKIAWTLRADPLGPETSIFRTETRAVATDDDARRRFRRYWAFVSPGVSLIRSLSLGPLKRDAERRARSRVARSS